MSTRFIVQADYVPVRSDIAPPRWWFKDQAKAEAFARSLTSGTPPQGVAMAYQNVSITRRD